MIQIIIDFYSGEISNPYGENYFKYFNFWSLPYIKAGSQYISLYIK